MLSSNNLKERDHFDHFKIRIRDLIIKSKSENLISLARVSPKQESMRSLRTFTFPVEYRPFSGSQQADVAVRLLLLYQPAPYPIPQQQLVDTLLPTYFVCSKGRIASLCRKKNTSGGFYLCEYSKGFAKFLMRIASKYRRIQIMQIIFFAITFLLPVCYKKKRFGPFYNNI